MKWTRGPVIGRGSYATVYLATTATGDQFAVKSGDLSISVSLQKEQHILSQLNSPYIISYKGHDITYNNTPMYNLHMEYAPGGTIYDMIKKHGGSLDESLIRSYTRQILLGLDHLHLHNLVHCDIKCRNILVGKNCIKIGDLGCAKYPRRCPSGKKVQIYCGGPTIKPWHHLIYPGTRDLPPSCWSWSDQHERGNQWCHTPFFKSVENRGRVVPAFSGTPVFMAPEVARGEEQGFAADVWALGCVIIEMATGCNPWPDVNDPILGLYQIGYSGEVPELPRWLSPEGKDLLALCLKRDARERYTVKELLKHPFVVNFDMGFEKVEEFMKNSPTSVLNQDFWGSLEVPETSPETSRKVKFSGDYPVERILQLVKGNPLCLPNWTDDEDWIMIRSDYIKESLKISKKMLSSE